MNKKDTLIVGLVVFGLTICNFGYREASDNRNAYSTHIGSIFVGNAFAAESEPPEVDIPLPSAQVESALYPSTVTAIKTAKKIRDNFAKRRTGINALEENGLEYDRINEMSETIKEAAEKVKKNQENDKLSDDAEKYLDDFVSAEGDVNRHMWVALKELDQQVAAYAGTLRVAAEKEGDFGFKECGIENATTYEAIVLGKMWVGKGYRKSSDPAYDIIISNDGPNKQGLKQFRYPKLKTKGKGEGKV
ncbi:MAG: hypothetical protein HY537_02035 [Deltaproteobacteria bacterium]|nr:hypothetical protein [Deltaproteobacteria bacterium]